MWVWVVYLWVSLVPTAILSSSKYLGIRAEWVDMSEVHRRITYDIYDKEEYNKALAWAKEKCPEGYDKNIDDKKHTREQKDKEWEFVVKMTLICRDIMLGNEKLSQIGWEEEALGRNGIAGGFQGQRMWSDWLPNGDFTEAILNSSFDWNGKKSPIIFATENDSLNAVSMLFGNLLTNTASVFADIRTCWSPEAVERVTGKNLKVLRRMDLFTLLILVQLHLTAVEHLRMKTEMEQ